ncbi:HTTM domain-containing protein [Marinoscillum sp.]|uniref:HTTM domain-containing protein n=1 Tax=Marinoscillum sp. TaxID=2024838 RepID=UPI003BA85258
MQLFPSVDNRKISLTAIRLIVCFLIMKNMIFYLPMADDLFGYTGIFPYPTYLGLLNYYGLNFLAYPFHLQLLPEIYLVMMVVLAILYSLGYGGRITGMLLFIGIMVLKLRNGFILDGSDNVIQVILPFLVIADSHFHFRYTPRKKPATNPYLKELQGAAVLALMIQVCFVYFFTSLAKIQGELWLNGTAVYYTMRVHDFMATPYNITLTKNHYFVVLSTYFTLFWEMSFAFLIWFRKTKYFVMLGGVMLHLGIWIFMRIDNFSWIMMGSYLIFISDEEYLDFRERVLAHKITVYIDSWCQNCVRFGKLTSRLNIGLIEIADIRNLNQPETGSLDTGRAMQEMATVNRKGVIRYGYPSLIRIALRTPALWLLLPILLLFKLTTLGDLIYQQVAIKRKIIPFGCSPTTCLIEETK